MGYNTGSAWAESPSYELYLVANRLLKRPTQLEIIHETVAWMERNFFHATSECNVEECSWEVYGDDPSGYAYSLTMRQVFEEMVVGCQHTSRIVLAALRSIKHPGYLYAHWTPRGSIPPNH